MDAVFKIDPTTGDRTVISIGADDAANASPQINSGNEIGTGTSFQSPNGITIDGSGMLLITDSSAGPNDAVFVVDPATGNRTILSNDSTPDTNNQLSSPNDIIVHSTLGILVTDSSTVGSSADAVVKVNASSGIRTVHSGDGVPNTTNSMSTPKGMAEDTDGSILIGDTSIDKLIRVSQADGSRTVVVDLSADSKNVDGVVVDGSGTVYFTQTTDDEVFKVSGASAVLASGASLGTGPRFSGLNSGIAVFTQAVATSTDVTLAGGVLTIEDTVGVANSYTFSLDTTPNPDELVISDPGNTLGASIPGSSGSGTDELRVPLDGQRYVISHQRWRWQRRRHVRFQLRESDHHHSGNV